ncbi:hypothetical protein [Burkholderia sp. JKS000303]|uniref:hypothetical protein n=1 Tax=Burkholderia sp. JKS000303 TaxID=1938747 RepID=UPI000BF27DE5|nr:hypothetical protein [Burkholderia sp. JKS000303]PFH12862.1 hypothetical protein BX604_7282 [Burkholderia sp. JKS000303]
MIVHTSIATPVEVLPFHKSAYDIVAAARKAEQTMAAKLCVLLTSRYGDTMPTFAQYRADHDALAELAKAKGLTDNQWVRKPYAAAVIATYGALPVSMDAASVTKRAQRLAELEPQAQKAYADAKQAAIDAGKSAPIAEAIAQHAVKTSKKAATPSAGAPKGETQVHPVSQSESVEQFVARVGIFTVLDACTHLLAAERKTALQAKTLNALSDQLRRELQPAKKAA